MKREEQQFYSNTISGVELKVKFAFPKCYFTKEAADMDKSVLYDVGIMTDIMWNISNSASAKHTMSSTKAIDINAGMEIAQGEFVFKTFHKESLSVLKEEILKGIDKGRKKFKFATTSDNPFVTLEDINESINFEQHTDAEKVNWAQMPLFDIILISSATDESNKKEIRIKTLYGVKLTSTGFAESIASVEMNTMASFMSIGGISDWELVANE